MFSFQVSFDVIVNFRGETGRCAASFPFFNAEDNLDFIKLTITTPQPTDRKYYNFLIFFLKLTTLG
ncbi:MAG: hypothetical protein A2Y25_00335 [Candidatus Melainabacteria bacterium GWF2_37_15]|nr:MAG: hypothetical protein A2Y25_00335 [Candidatus Melainabacteria bacterium GWF2_37_15]